MLTSADRLLQLISMCWETVVVLVALQVVLIQAGEISDFNYGPGSYRLNGPMSMEIVLLTTRENHQFTLALQRYSSRWGNNANRNIVQVYYGSYLLENMKAPKYDALNEYVITQALIQSVKPVSPAQDVDQPPTITVRYSKVDGSCVERTYEYKPSAEQYKNTSHNVVDGGYCR